MYRYLLLSLVMLSCAVAGHAATTVVVNGNVVQIQAVELNGQVYVDPIALMQLLGGKATFLPDTHKLMINSNVTPPAATPAAENWGTAQMPGESGQIGQVYSICKREPLYFRLNSAEFTTNQVLIGDDMTAPKVNEKLMVLHFSVQNPAQVERMARGDVLKFTFVDEMNVNHVARMLWGDEENHQKVGLNLKPAQRLQAYAVVTVPAKGLVPKLIVESNFEQGLPVLRYDLRDKVKPLEAPVADPNDPTGATALETVPATTGMACPLADLTVTLEKTEYLTTGIGNDKPPVGGRLLAATLLFKCVAPNGGVVRADSLEPVLTDDNGIQLKRFYALVGATSDQAVSQPVTPGQEVRARIYFAVPAGATAKTLLLCKGQSRKYQFEIPNE